MSFYVSSVSFFNDCPRKMISYTLYHSFQRLYIVLTRWLLLTCEVFILLIACIHICMYVYIYPLVCVYIYISNFCWRNYIGMLYKLSFLFSISQYRLGKTVSHHSATVMLLILMLSWQWRMGKKILQMILIQQALTINVFGSYLSSQP